MQRIGLFGGSFNPIHLGHLIPAQAAAEQLGLDKLIFVPSAHPPHKPVHPSLAPPEQRLEMVRRAIQGHPLFDLSDVELTRSGPSYTVDTVAHFRREFGLDVLVHWLIGADSLAELPAWHRAAELIDACRIVTLVRPGWPVDAALARLGERLGEERTGRLAAGVLATPMIEISATQIRRRIATGKPIRYLTPSVVAEYISQHQIYRRTGANEQMTNDQ